VGEGGVGVGSCTGEGRASGVRRRHPCSLPSTRSEISPVSVGALLQNALKSTFSYVMPREAEMNCMGSGGTGRWGIRAGDTPCPVTGSRAGTGQACGGPSHLLSFSPHSLSCPLSPLPPHF
jgi:hypothetical protein